ncbi:MAG: NAD-dependent epimerase [Desulfonatronovibrionaceae bacterium]
MKFLVTGAAGFIGYHLCRALLDRDIPVVGLDNLNDYYSVQLKKDRLSRLTPYRKFSFTKIDLFDQSALQELFGRESITHVVNLAAQAGVRYSLENPLAYIQSNITGFTHLLECCRHNRIKHLIFASSSSVYGLNTRMPFSVHDNVDHPISLYAASKKSNELMAHTYAYLYGLPCTGLRFFTVYGPWGRPDMALFLFTRAMLEGRAIDVYNHGNMRRDFTYIDDIVRGIYLVSQTPPSPNPYWQSETPDPSSSPAPYKIYNIGNNNSVSLMHFIHCLEKELGLVARKNFLPLQPGDVPETYANVDDLIQDTGYRPGTPVEEGIAAFVHWYKEYHKIS